MSIRAGSILSNPNRDINKGLRVIRGMANRDINKALRVIRDTTNRDILLRVTVISKANSTATLRKAFIPTGIISNWVLTPHRLNNMALLVLRRLLLDRLRQPPQALE
jgi:hypothetical protein